MTTASCRLVLVGFGNVGQGVARSLASNPEILAHHGLVVRLTGVVDPRFGAVADPEGLDPEHLLAAVNATGSFDRLDGAMAADDIGSVIEASMASVMAELTYTDLATGEPAVSHIRTALERGVHVATSNKGPIALHVDSLERMAAANQAILSYEGTVMSGTPALRLGSELLAAAGVLSISGVLNGTTNYMIGRMASGATFEDALAEAQHKGYAEADPSGDLEGLDAAAKLVILARAVFGQAIAVGDVERVPLTASTAGDMAPATAGGQGWRMVAALEPANGSFRASVAPRALDAGDGLLGVAGSTNAITFHTEMLGPVTLTGPGAGRTETACAIMSDLLSINQAVGS
ncbi:homoserine dehydrogenase [soil metagenome]